MLRVFNVRCSRESGVVSYVALNRVSALLCVKEQGRNSFDARQWDVEDAVPYMQGKVCCRAAMRNVARFDSGCF